jgi:AcrR family transcriptional regulator
MSSRASQDDGLAAQPMTVFDMWSRPDPAARKPRFSRAEIAVAAMRLADAEGVGALSMRRIASELDAGTMTLYHYVQNKEELYSLVIDEVMGELIVPSAELPNQWRAALNLIAYRARTTLLMHTWMFDMFDHPGFGPNAIRHFEQCLEVLNDLPSGTSLADRVEIVGAVDEFVFGHVLLNRSDADQLSDEAGLRYVETLVAKGGFPTIARTFAEHGVAGTWQTLERMQSDPDRFTRSLDALLDGFEARFAKRA